MKLALVASLVAPIRAREANGPHSVIIDLAHGLAARGHEVTVYAAEGSSVDGVAVREIAVGRAARDAAIRPGRTVPVEAEHALRLGFERLYDELRRDAPDVVSQHAFDAAAIELARGLRVLHTLHLPPLSADVVGAARATSTSLATVSEAARQRWRTAGVSIRYVLRNGVPKRDLANAPIAPIALIAGRVSPEKGTDVAIRVARASRLIPLVVGDVYDEDYFARDVKPLLKEGEFIGPVSRAELFELMARCSVLLMPVRWEEPFGLVAAEAQMAGCPVAGYRRGALPQVVKEGVGGFLAEPDRERSLLSACERAISLDRAVIRCRAERELGAEAMVDGYERVLIDLRARSAY